MNPAKTPPSGIRVVDASSVAGSVKPPILRLASAKATTGRKKGSSRPTNGKIRLVIDTAFHGLGDRLAALCATRILARELPQYKFAFVSGLEDVITFFGPDHLVEYCDPKNQGLKGYESIRISMNPDWLHRRKWGSDSVNYVGSYLMAAAGPQLVKGTPRMELPRVPRHEGLDFDYIVLQPRAGFAKPDMPVTDLQSIVDKSPLPVVCAGDTGTEQHLRHVNYDYLGDEVCMLKLIRHASLVLTPRSASAHIAAAYNVPCICWVPNDGENWHLDYQGEWSRVLLPVDEESTRRATIAWMRNNIPVPKRTVLCVGDESSPGYSFNLGSMSFVSPFSPRAFQSVENQVVVYGGGSQPSLDLVQTHGKKCVIWGTGMDLPCPKEEPVYDTSVLQAAGLCGIRDYGIAGQRWVPDPSCMSPLFDIWSCTEPKHEVVFYSHRDMEIPIDGYPRKTNFGEGPEVAIPFLSSGDVVVTNSYFGVYWATLLGRRVVCWEPSNMKFFYFRHPPLACNAKNCRVQIGRSSRWGNALEECRKANRDFYADVLEFINSP